MGKTFTTFAVIDRKPAPKPNAVKSKLHRRNKHKHRYNFMKLIELSPELCKYVAINKYGIETIDFFNATAVKLLNQALLNQAYGIQHWDIPSGYLCPPIPGRADYIHHIADVLGESYNKQIPKEHISFPTFKYTKLVETEWEDSDFKSILETKFFFVFYQYEGKNLILRKVKFWNMPYSDILEAKTVWDKMIETLLKGKIIQEVTKAGRRKTFFPKKTENRVSHVRPHAKNAKDTYQLPIADELTGATEYTKHCFWLNASYVKATIYEDSKTSLNPYDSDSSEYSIAADPKSGYGDQQILNLDD